MARMSIDDKLLRDPRVLRLARGLGWSRRETVGALLDVFAVAYDRERDTLPTADIDVAAEREGFADAMFEVDLAEQVRGGVRIKGARERIKYLTAKVEAGRIGGLKSAETRRNKAKQKRSTLQAPVNLPDPVPDSVPDPVPEDQSSPSAHAIPPSPVPAPPVPSVPVVSPPAPPREDIARTHAAPYDHTDDRSRGRLAEATYQRVSDARVAMAVELRLPAQLPFPPVTPSSRARAFCELLDRVREEGAGAPAACDRVVASLIAQARESRGPEALEWLSQKAFGSGAWATARERVPGASKAARELAARYGKAPIKAPTTAPVPTARETERPVMVSDAERAEAAEMALELRARLFGEARAPPASSSSTPDQQPQSRPKAAT